MNEFEYYLIDRKNQPDLPVFAFKDVDDGDIFFRKEAIVPIKSLEMCLMQPRPSKPSFVDFHSASDVLAFGEKLYKVLKPLNLHRVQFIQVSVEVKKGEVLEGYYWVMHNYTRVECMDLKKSDCKINDKGRVTWINKIVLSHEKLSKVPLEERLFFRMKESYSTHLVHQSVVDKMQVINPEGLKFTPVEKWRQGMQFDQN